MFYLLIAYFVKFFSVGRVISPKQMLMAKMTNLDPSPLTVGKVPEEIYILIYLTCFLDTSIQTHYNTNFAIGTYLLLYIGIAFFPTTFT